MGSHSIETVFLCVPTHTGCQEYTSGTGKPDSRNLGADISGIAVANEGIVTYTIIDGSTKSTSCLNKPYHSVVTLTCDASVDTLVLEFVTNVCSSYCVWGVFIYIYA